MTSKLGLTIFTLAFITAVAGLQCYETNMLYCGDHGEEYDEFCDSLNVSRIEPREISCPVYCGKLSGSYEYKEEIGVYYLLTGCTADPTGCLRDEQFEKHEPEIYKILQFYEVIIPDLELVSSGACSCGKDLCNSALRSLSNKYLWFLPVIAMGLSKGLFA